MRGRYEIYCMRVYILCHCNCKEYFTFAKPKKIIQEISPMVLPGGGHCVKVATLFPNQSTEDCSRKQLKMTKAILNIHLPIL
jgi:hypothetical protein